MDFLQAYRAQRSGIVAGGVDFAVVDRVMLSTTVDDPALQAARLKLVALHLVRERGPLPMLNFESAVRLSLMVRHWSRIGAKAPDMTWVDFANYMSLVDDDQTFESGMSVLEDRISSMGGYRTAWK